MDDNLGTTIQYASILDQSYYADYAVGAELKDFFSRPVLISAPTWDVGNNLDTGYDIWHAYFNNAVIKKKLDNYGLLSCNLHIKVIINATPFHYGAAIVSYRPLSGYVSDNVSFTSDRDMYLMALSQRPHFWIYASPNQGGEMVLPFFLNKNWLNVSDAQEFIDMGRLTIRSVAPLQTASTSTTGSTVSIYAWAENVKLTGPTVGLSLQSRDEYVQRPVSYVASAVAEASGALSRIPIIAPFAKASEMVFGAVASVARFFGFTNVPVIDAVAPFKDMPFGHFASPDISTPIERLTIDPKNELTIDPRTVGLPPEDEMLLSKFVGREAYLGTYDWETSDSPDHIVFASTVNPGFVNFNNSINSRTISTTPLFFASTLFSYWRGDIIFRFRFIATPYHRGRVRIIFDPFSDNVSNVETTTTSFNKIIDITEKKDIEVRVPYMQARPFLSMNGTYKTKNYGTTASPIDIGTINNGTLVVRVLSRLTAPVTNATVKVLVSVRGAENFEFAAPRAIDPDYSTLVPQSGDEYAKLEYDDPELISASNNAQSNTNPHKYLMHFGEVIRSMRLLLHRTNLYRAEPVTLPTGPENSVLYRIEFPRFPVSYGYATVPNGLDWALSGDGINTRNFNYVHNIVLNWLNSCFLAYRGSLNYSFNLDGIADVCDLRAVRTHSIRTTGLVAQPNVDRLPLLTGDPSTYDIRRLMANTSCMLTGGSLVNQKTQSGLQVNVPDYNPTRFRFADQVNTLNGKLSDDSAYDSMNLQFTINQGLATASHVKVWTYVSAGHDFSFFFFLNTPFIHDIGIPDASSPP